MIIDIELYYMQKKYNIKIIGRISVMKARKHSVLILIVFIIYMFLSIHCKVNQSTENENLLFLT